MQDSKRGSSGSKSLILLAVTLGVLLFWGSPSQAEQPLKPPCVLLLEVAPICSEYAPDEEVLLRYTLTNCSKKAFSIRHPWVWNGIVWHWFKVFQDGEVLENPLSYKDYDFRMTTTLAPGEQVTYVFQAWRTVRFKKNPEDRVGLYMVETNYSQPLYDGEMVFSPKRAAFRIVPKNEKRSLGEVLTLRGSTELTLSKAEDVVPFKRILQSRTLESGDQLRLLQRARKTGSKDRFWEVLLASPDVYAVVTMVDSLEKSWLDAESLFTLLEHKDLAVRRCAVQALGRLGSQPKLVERLKKFLATQTDEPTLSFGKEAVKLLQSKR